MDVNILGAKSRAGFTAYMLLCPNEMPMFKTANPIENIEKYFGILTFLSSSMAAMHKRRTDDPMTRSKNRFISETPAAGYVANIFAVSNVKLPFVK